ncbi:MAG: hypothetical protein CM1200mP41_33590 [Gammaproteobacteria bacterium]|nr:MAG: hypothetical protein CM1200mP41_33590 [Gammaproteobacteria bacterium]
MDVTEGLIPLAPWTGLQRGGPPGDKAYFFTGICQTSPVVGSKSTGTVDRKAHSNMFF